MSKTQISLPLISIQIQTQLILVTFSSTPLLYIMGRFNGMAIASETNFRSVFYPF